MDTINYNSECQAVRWLGYFDLLGTSALIKSNNAKEVFTAYRECLEQLGRWGERHANVHHAWFSDTFIMYSEDDAGVSFGEIEMECRWLAFSLLRRKIPVRGALSCGDFYADRANSLYLGSALLEAYEWGENQDWIGFILCPSAVQRFKELKSPVANMLNYAEYAVPFKKDPPSNSDPVGACILGNNINWGGTWDNRLLPILTVMAESQTDSSIQLKYKRTIEFLVKHKRWPV